MAIRVHRHANVSKQATLLGGVDVGAPKWHVCRCDLTRFVHEGMNGISNVKVHLKTCSGNVNIFKLTHFIGDEIAFSRTPDLDFRCFYPCEIFLSYIPTHTRLSDPYVSSLSEKSVPHRYPCEISVTNTR